MKKTLTFIATALVIFMFALTLNNCNKVLEVKDTTSTGVNPDNSKAMVAHILAFKQKMQYYKDNPALRDNGATYESDSAVLNMEALLNFNFCYTNIHCNKKSFEHSEVTMPLDNNNEISEADLSTVYDVIIDTIKMQMHRVDYDSIKLLLVDLEITGTDNNGDAVVSVGSLIGNRSETGVQYTDGWKYGEHEGLCTSGWYNNEDAATQLDARVTNAMIPIPQTGCRWFFTELDSVYIYPKQDQLDPTPDNYRDYKIYYAIDVDNDNTLTITDSTKCLMESDMSFYEAYYIDYAQNVETEKGKKYDYCKLSGNPYVNQNSNGYHIQHDYTIFVGYRFLECTIDVENISNY